MTAVLDTKIAFNLSFFFPDANEGHLWLAFIVSKALGFLIDYFLEQPSLPLENSLNFQTKPNATETLQNPWIKRYYTLKKAFDFRSSRASIHQQHPSLPPVDARKWTPGGHDCHVLQPSTSLYTSIMFSDCTYCPESESQQISQMIRRQ